jgi:hypothetical protein
MLRRGRSTKKELEIGLSRARNMRDGRISQNLLYGCMGFLDVEKLFFGAVLLLVIRRQY